MTFLTSLFSCFFAPTIKKERLAMLFSIAPIRNCNHIVKAALTFAATVAFAVSLTACGGGGGSSTPLTTPVSTTPTSPTTPVAAMGCGTVTSTGTGNSTQVVVDGFPCSAAAGVSWPQVPYVSVKICAPGSTTNCQIIDHIILDTGSTGLRIANAALSSSLQAALSANPGTTASTSLTECEQYVDSYIYGPVVNVDVYIAGESAKSTQMQIFGDDAKYPVPTACSNNAGQETDSISSFGGNGLLGVNFSAVDYTDYFDCNNNSLSNCAMNNYLGIPNTVAQFGADGNGVTITLPAVGASGSLTAVVGTLNFGVGTQTDNTPTSNVTTLANDGNIYDSTFGTFAVQVAGTTAWTSAYIDSGTDAVYFNDPANTNLVDCPSTPVYYSGLYCPTTAQSVSFNYSNYGSNSIVTTVPYSIVNPNSLNENIVAFDNEAGYISSANTTYSEIAIGLSTFYGHTNYVIFNGATAPGTGFGGTASTTVTGPINGIQ